MRVRKTRERASERERWVGGGGRGDFLRALPVLCLSCGTLHLQIYPLVAERVSQAASYYADFRCPIDLQTFGTARVGKDNIEPSGARPKYGVRMYPGWVSEI